MTTYAPQNPYPESMRNVFETTVAPSRPGGKGPSRFEEGVTTDTDVPRDFQQGAWSDTAPARPRLAVPAPESVFKYPEQTMRERAHVGSASWIEAPEMLGDFVQGSMSGEGQPSFEYAYNSGLHQNRPNAVRLDS